MPYVFANTQQFVEIVGLFVLLHQAAIEIWKMTGPKTRRYWEALAYILYGPSLRKEEPGEKQGLERLKTAAEKVVGFVKDTVLPFPSSVDQNLREASREMLIQSFLLRGVGDSPVTEISDSDIKNINNIVRQVADEDVRRTSQLLEQFISAGTQNAAEVTSAFGRLQTDKPELRAMLARWVKDIENREKVSTAFLMYWRDQFNERFLEGVVRAEKELANALKAAEYGYLRLLSKVSVFFAAAEAFIIGCILVGNPLPSDMALLDLTSLKLSANFLLTFALSFAGLILLPQGTQSLLKAIVGLGKRLAA